MSRAEAASGAEVRSLFGLARRFDFSQFTPRGHYTDAPELSRYFRAMMWLQRVDFRLIETQDSGEQVFSRRQLEAALALRALMDDAALSRWRDIDQAVQAFVGEADYMLPPDLDAFLAELGADDARALEDRSDAELAQKILDGGWGAQRISSHYMVNGIGQGTMPLNRSLAFFGQRYTVDAHVFSNVVYDRVQGGAVRRMMPDSLDVAYAALGNDAALPLLASELTTYAYAPDLESMRILVDEHGDAYWGSSLYTLWMSSLRGLSTRADDGFAAGLPAVMRTEPWSRRVLAAQLASWAELRHDTLLYAKQSYTSGAACEFPDAYVDPYPAFWRALERYGSAGLALVENLSAIDAGLAALIRDHFVAVEGASRILAEMAEHELAGTPFTAEHMAFIDQTVQVESVCGDAWVIGWYGRLHFDLLTSTEVDPVVADVHTQPTDAGGVEVGRVLHVGTSLPRAMVVTVDTCTGRARVRGPRLHVPPRDHRELGAPHRRGVGRARAHAGLVEPRSRRRAVSLRPAGRSALRARSCDGGEVLVSPALVERAIHRGGHRGQERQPLRPAGHLDHQAHVLARHRQLEADGALARREHAAPHAERGRRELLEEREDVARAQPAGAAHLETDRRWQR
ncbi:MAG: DUF3160 domain-containing protein [Sandaracinaceae bacterium]|nr:DUF3160 domain-containing protein [Sandaracinaceae bacterium]